MLAVGWCGAFLVLVFENCRVSASIYQHGQHVSVCFVLFCAVLCCFVLCVSSC
jgi:hypothetical protein